MNKSKLKIIILVVFIVAAILSIKFTGIGGYIDQEKLSTWIEGYGTLAPLVYILIFSIAPSFMLPGLPITIVGGILFGPVYGIIYTAIGATIGASLSFLVSRHMGREWVERLFKDKGGRLKKLDSDVARGGWKVVAFTRLIPLFPFNFLNYAFGLTGISFTSYTISSFIFMLPGTAAYIIFSSSLLDLARGKASPTFIAGVVLVIVVSAVPIIYKKVKDKRARNEGR